jgi:transcriptional regulator with XRE-family HTH domain
MKKHFDISTISDEDLALLQKLAEKFTIGSDVLVQQRKSPSQKDGRVMMGNILKKIRKNNDLSQVEVSKRLSLSNPNFISIIESGKSAPPKNKIFKFANAYDADVLLSFALLKYTMNDWWQLWLEVQAHLSEEGWPDPFVVEQKVVEWVEKQLRS